MENKLSQLEEELRKVPGIRNARVVGDGEPTEIHIVAGPSRSPKQLVRDVQSLSAAGFGMSIDHRIVSVVRVNESAAPPTPVPPPQEEAQPSPPGDVGKVAGDAWGSPPTPAAPAPEPPIQGAVESRPSEESVAAPEELASNGERPVVERVILASKGDAGWVKVGLRWPDGEVTEGAGTAGMSRESRARGATTALLNAMEPALQKMRAHIDIDQVVIHRLGSQDSVLVRAVFYERGAPTAVVGSALVHDDVATAAVRAMLQAVNRKLLTARA